MRAPLRTGLVVALFCSNFAAAAAPETVELTKLPAGAIKLDGKSATWLLVTVRKGQVVKVESATAKTGNVTVTTVTNETNDTTVKFESHLSKTLKLDLYISSDGKSFNYTSSCPLMAEKALFENWQQSVPWLAVGGARGIDDQESACD